MTARLRRLVQSIINAFWVVPAVLVAGLAVLAILVVDVQLLGHLPSWIPSNWIYGGGDTGARTLLGAIASSTIGVAGTLFSITIAALTLASNQMGPRLLRNFMRDRGNQLTLGVFLGTFAYCLIVLRAVRGGEADAFVPSLGVTIGLLLAAACIGLLIYFIHHRCDHLRRGRWQIASLSTIGVVASVVMVAGGLYALSRLTGLDVPLIWCFVFGAVVSPTDPVAVMGVLKTARAPPTLQATIAGESLFNDGVGVVIFSILLASAVGGDAFSLVHAGELFLIEALGGALLGGLIGWIGYRAMKAVDDYSVEVMVTLAVVMGGYALAHALHVSGPVAMAVAGLIIGNPGVSFAMSDQTKDYVLKFWALIDEVLNAVLFLLIGLEAVVLADRLGLLGLGLLTIPLVLVARALSVGVPLLFWRDLLPFRLAFRIMTWGGLRGGISIALALSLPPGPMKDILVAATYVVVLFSVLVQGGSIGGLVKHWTNR